MVTSAFVTEDIAARLGTCKQNNALRSEGIRHKQLINKQLYHKPTRDDCVLTRDAEGITDLMKKVNCNNDDDGDQAEAGN